MARCKPGDLCIVIRGAQVGLTVRVEREATEREVLRAIQSVLGIRFAAVRNKCQLWRIDLPISWANMSNLVESCLVAYAPDDNLMPITPPDEVKQEEQSKELTL
jgi:hypothetical protein